MDSVSIITAIQSLGAWLEAPMKFFSFLGEEDFFLIFLPLIYWSINTTLGIRIGYILFAGASLNQYFKMLMHGPRPFWVSTDVRALVSETSFGVPSGHAQVASGIWGIIPVYYRKTWVWIAALLLIFFIGFSRLYLGVHFLHDVLLGWAFGFLTLWAFAKFWEPVETRVKQMSFWSQVGLAFVVSLIMVLIGVLVQFVSSQNFVLPTEWIANAAHAGAEAPAPFYFSVRTLITSAGTMFGLSLGLAWITPRGGFNASGPVWKRAARFVVGLVGVMVFYVGLKAIFPEGEELVPYIFRYIRYTLIGFWVSGLGPWVFAKLNLTEKQ